MKPALRFLFSLSEGKVGEVGRNENEQASFFGIIRHRTQTGADLDNAVTHSLS
jgi:hypothetical protein